MARQAVLAHNQACARRAGAFTRSLGRALQGRIEGLEVGIAGLLNRSAIPVAGFSEAPSVPSHK